MSERKIKLLSDYAMFLERSLSISGFNISRSNIIELTSDDVSINSINPSLKLVSASKLDDILRFPTLEPDVDIVYAQFPIKEIMYTLDNMSAVPVLTEMSSVLGSFGLSENINLRKRNLEYIEMFRNLLYYYDVDVEVFETENSDEYFNLTIGHSKLKTRR